jgi:PST family polysaccharide transporter
MSGVIWSGLNTVASVLLPLAIFVFFAHAVSPALIGVVALGVACAEILKTVGMQGLYEALLQQHEDLQRCHETACAVLLACGTALLVVHVAAIHVLGMFMPDVAANEFAVDLVGLRIFLDLAALQPQAALAQRLSYRRLGIRALVGNSTAGVIGIGVSLSVHPLFGLVTYQVGQSAMMFVTTAFGTDSMARPRFHRDCFRRMRREATLSTGVRIVASSISNLDQVIIAPLVGSLQLAYYNLGKRMESTFITASSSFGAILFQPLFAHRIDGQQQHILRRGIAVLTIVCGLPAAVFIANAHEALTLVFGQQWGPATLVAVILTLSGMTRAISAVPGALLSVSGRNHDLLVLATGSAVAGILAVAGLAQFGIIACAAALAIKNFLAVGWAAYITRRQAPDPVRTYSIASILPFVLMLAGGMAGHWAAVQLVPGTGTVQRLLFLVVAGIPAGVVCAAYYGVFFQENLRTYVAPLRARLSRQAAS